MSQCDELLALLMEAVKQQAAPGGEEKQIRWAFPTGMCTFLKVIWTGCSAPATRWRR